MSEQFAPSSDPLDERADKYFMAAIDPVDALGSSLLQAAAGRVEELEGIMLSKEGMASLGMREIQCRLEHDFQPGVYLRTIHMPAGARVIGHRHTTEHFNIVLSGRALVLIDGVPHEVRAPCKFISTPGVRKVLGILEDMAWMTIHANPDDYRPNLDDPKDLAKFEDRFIVRSPTWIAAKSNAEFFEHCVRHTEMPESLQEILTGRSLCPTPQ